MAGPSCSSPRWPRSPAGLALSPGSALPYPGDQAATPAPGTLPPSRAAAAARVPRAPVQVFSPLHPSPPPLVQAQPAPHPSSTASLGRGRAGQRGREGGRVSRDALTLPQATPAHPSRGSCRSRGRSEAAVPEGPVRLRMQGGHPCICPIVLRGDGGGRGKGRGRQAPLVRAATRTLEPGRPVMEQAAGCRCGIPGAAKEPGGRRPYLSGFTGGGPAWAREGARVPELRAACCSRAALGAVTAAPRDGLRAPRPPRPAPRPSRRAGWLRAEPEPSRQLVRRAGRGRASRPPRGWG